MQIQFKHLISLEERLCIFPLYTQLNPYLTFEKFSIRMEAQMVETGYHLLAVYNFNELIATSGYWISNKLYCGKYLEPDNVVVDKGYRSKGIGEMMQKEMETIAKESQCNAMMLDAYLENIQGHKFYEKHNYEKKGFHFVKKLSPNS